MGVKYYTVIEKKLIKYKKKKSLEGVRRMPLAPFEANKQLEEHADKSKGHQKRRGITSGTTRV